MRYFTYPHSLRYENSEVDSIVYRENDSINNLY